MCLSSRLNLEYLQFSVIKINNFTIIVIKTASVVIIILNFYIIY